MEKNGKGLTIASIIFLWINIICLLGLTLFVIFVIRKISPMYYDSGVRLPIITRIISSSHYIFIILALILIIKERLKKKLVTLFINIAVCIILVLGVFPLSVRGILLPMHQVSEVLESAGISGIDIMEASIIAKEVCKEEGWEWANIHTEETDSFWGFTTNYNRTGSKAFIRIDKKTGKVLEKHIIGP